jgi:hypothetical protein
LTPLVSSSKNRSNPALDAGSGAFFFLLLIATVWRTLRRLNRLRLGTGVGTLGSIMDRPITLRDGVSKEQHHNPLSSGKA